MITGLTLIVIGLIALPVWVVSLYLWPYAPCRKCEGSRRNAGSSKKRFGQCRRCKGAVRRIRLGARTVPRGRLALADRKKKASDEIQVQGTGETAGGSPGPVLLIIGVVILASSGAAAAIATAVVELLIDSVALVVLFVEAGRAPGVPGEAPVDGPRGPREGSPDRPYRLGRRPRGTARAGAARTPAARSAGTSPALPRHRSRAGAEILRQHRAAGAIKPETSAPRHLEQVSGALVFSRRAQPRDRSELLSLI